MKKGHMVIALFGFVLALFGAVPAYAAEEISIQPEIILNITGDIPSSAESFTFVLEAIDDAPMPQNNQINISGTGKGSFPSIIYTKPETYHYTVRQIAGHAEGYVYDDAVYYLIVQVTTNDAGSLNAVFWISESGSSQKIDHILFTNQYFRPDSNGTGEIPQTGDTSNLASLWVVSMASLLGLMIVRSLYAKTGKNGHDQ